MEFFFLIFLSLFSLFNYIICWNCGDITPDFDDDCTLSEQDSLYYKYCCYIISGSNSYDSDNNNKKCIPIDEVEYEKLENAYKDKNTYGSYGFINSFKCNEYNDKNNDNDETDCEDKYPQKPSDCKLSSSELLNNNDVCCYRKTYTGYCEKHSKSEIDSIVNRLDAYTTFICISSNEFLKVSLLSLILFLFL